MKFYLLTYITFLFVTLTSCNQNIKTHIAQASDYEQYLSPDQHPNAVLAKKELDFWTKKITVAPNQYPYQAKIAGAHTALFEQTGDINHLIEAYELYKALNKKTKNTRSSYLRALARNCISQHKFKEAYKHLKIAETNGDNLRSTQKMLFDVTLELGQAKEAKRYLDIIAEKDDFDYKIRLSKWKDHEGNLDEAIVLMEKSMADAKEKKNDALILWSATNLGDFYGHAGRIEDAYQQYLNTLKLDPNNTYALKGIAWIAFSHDKNIQEAKRILQALNQRQSVPDYNLLLAELADYEDNDQEEKEYIDRFLKQVNNPLYGDMYNTYKANLSKKPNEIMAIAQREINNRPTPQSYALLAWSYLKSNEYQKALDIIEENVMDKTSEPDAQYKMAVIYKANNLMERTQALKTELGGSLFELGPVMEKKIGSL